MDVTVDGCEPHFRQVGAIIGPGDNPDLPVGFAIAAQTWDGPIIVIWIETDPAFITAGATIEISGSKIAGSLALIDPEVSPDPRLLGMLDDGELHFDAADTSDGAAVSGTVESLVYAPFE